MSMPLWNSPPSQPKPRVTVPAAGHENDSCPAAASSCRAAAGAAKTNAAAPAAATRTNPPTAWQPSSEDLGAPGQRAPFEQRVGPMHRSRHELLDPQGLVHLRKRDRTEASMDERVEVEWIFTTHVG